MTFYLKATGIPVDAHYWAANWTDSAGSHWSTPKWTEREKQLAIPAASNTGILRIWTRYPTHQDLVDEIYDVTIMDNWLYSYTWGSSKITPVEAIPPKANYWPILIPLGILAMAIIIALLSAKT